MSMTLTTDQITALDFTNDLLDRGWSLQRACLVLLTLSQIHLLRRLSAYEAEMLDDLADEYDSVRFFPRDGDRLIEIGVDGDHTFAFPQSALTGQFIYWCRC